MTTKFFKLALDDPLWQPLRDRATQERRSMTAVVNLILYDALGVHDTHAARSRPTAAPATPQGAGRVYTGRDDDLKALMTYAPTKTPQGRNYTDPTSDDDLKALKEDVDRYREREREVQRELADRAAQDVDPDGGEHQLGPDLADEDTSSYDDDDASEPDESDVDDDDDDASGMSEASIG